VCYIREDTAIPEHVDLKTGAVRYLLRPCHKFRISFDARGPRDEMKVRGDQAIGCAHDRVAGLAAA
jgi:hypothetical protein